MRLFLTYVMVSLLLVPNIIVLKHYVDNDPMLKYLQGGFVYIVFLLMVYLLISMPLAKILVNVK